MPQNAPLMFPPDIGNGFPAIQYQLYKFRDRDYVIDTVNDESGRVDRNFAQSVGGNVLGWVNQTVRDNTTVGSLGQTSETDEGNNDDVFYVEEEILITADDTTRIPSTTSPGNVMAPPVALGSIYLPLPNNVQNAYDIDWKMEDMELLTEIRKALDYFNNEQYSAALKSIGTGLYSILFGGIDRNLGTASPNPRKQAIFYSVEPRSFNFTHVFTPKSAQEASTIRQIVGTFAKFSLPSGSVNDALWQFPYEWRISFLNTKGYPEISYCVCKNVTIDYNQSGNQIMSDGHPHQMTLSLNFLETDLRRQESVGIQGFQF